MVLSVASVQVVSSMRQRDSLFNIVRGIYSRLLREYFSNKFLNPIKLFKIPSMQRLQKNRQILCCFWQIHSGLNFQCRSYHSMWSDVSCTRQRQQWLKVGGGL